MKGLLKHKKLLISLGIVAGLVLTVVVLLFTLFSVKSIELNFLNVSKKFASVEARQNLIDTSDLKLGGTVFGINKSSIIEKMEKDNPFIKIINIETVFPNRIVVHCAEREELFAVKAGEKKYFICDGEFKVLKMKDYGDLDETGNYLNSQSNAILFKGLETYIENINRINPGDFLVFDNESDMLKDIQESLNMNNKTVAEQRALIKSITLDSSIYFYTARNQPFLKITDFNDFVTNIYVPESKLASKFSIMFSVTSEIIYNVDKFLNEEEKQELLILSEQEKQNYYLNFNLLIEEKLNGDLNVRLNKIS